MPNVVKFPVASEIDLPPILLPTHAAMAPGVDGGPVLSVAELTQHAIGLCTENIGNAAIRVVSEANLRYIRKHMSDLNQLVEMYAKLVE